MTDRNTALRLLDFFRRMRELVFEENPLQDQEITPPQLSLMDWLYRHSGEGIVAIAEGIGLKAPTVSVAVNKLEMLGLCLRRTDPEDKRAVQIYLSKKGEELSQQAREFRIRKMILVLNGLDKEERDTLLSLLEKGIKHAETEETRPRM